MRFFTNMKLTMKLVLILSVILAGFIVIGITYLNIVQAERKAIATTSNFGRLHVEIENIVRAGLGRVVRLHHGRAHDQRRLTPKPCHSPIPFSSEAGLSVDDARLGSPESAEILPVRV
jgi:hypothetical protein